MRTERDDSSTELKQELHATLDSLFERLSAPSEPLFSKLVTQRLTAISHELKKLGEGEIVLENGDSWREAYEGVLRKLAFTEYYSVAWVRTSDYWRDTAGRRSIRLNYDLLDRGLRIERVAILPHELWPAEAGLPCDAIRNWLEVQHYRGVALRIIREKDIHREPELLRDFGIYGNCAVGEQELDALGRTIRFRLSYSASEIRRATEHWLRLHALATPFSEALDNA